MANILDLITVGDVWEMTVDADPSTASGTAAPIGSIAHYNSGSAGLIFIKTGAADTAWERVSTTASSGVINSGTYARLAVYSNSPTGNVISDSITQNSKLVDVAIASQATRSAAIQYNIPNPGDAITSADFVLTQGSQSISGAKTFNDDVVINGNFTVNTPGTLSYLNVTNTQIQDKLVTLNKGGSAASAGGAGLEFEENSIITGGFLVSADRLGFTFDAPASAYNWTLDSSNLTASRILNMPDEAGRVVVQSNSTPGVVNQVPYFASVNRIATPTGTSTNSLAWDSTNFRLGIGTSSPSVSLHIVGSARITDLNQALPVVTDVNGNLSNSAVSLTSQISGVLPIANGGTNSSTALSNGRVMISSSGSIVEASALTNNALVVGNTSGVVASLALGTANQILGMNAGGTANEYKTFSTGTTGTDFNISHAANSVVFNIPDASTTARGLVSIGAQSFNGDKTFNNNVLVSGSVGINAPSPARILDVNGTSIFRNALRIDNGTSNYEVFQANTTTTNATITNIATVAIASGTEVLIEARIVGKKTGGAGVGGVGDGATYIRTARFKNISGTVTMSNLQSDFTSEDQGAWNGTMAVSTTNAAIQVQGAANDNMSWVVTYFVQVL